MDTSTSATENGRELKFRQFLANVLSLFVIACLCYFVFAFGSMWFYAWQQNMYPFNPQRGIHPPWIGNPVLERGFDRALKASVLGFAAAVISGVLITNRRAVILIGCTMVSGIILVHQELSLLVD